VISAPDFKTTKAIRLSAATKFELVPPGGELKHGDLAEDVLELKVETYGKLISIDRTAIVNDDLGILQELPSILGAEGARTVSDLVFGLLNGAGADFFSAGNGNLLTGASSEPSVDALAEAIKRIRTQKKPEWQADWTGADNVTGASRVGSQSTSGTELTTAIPLQ
jgi:hypothetical protein